MRGFSGFCEDRKEYSGSETCFLTATERSRIQIFYTYVLFCIVKIEFFFLIQVWLVVAEFDRVLGVWRILKDMFFSRDLDEYLSPYSCVKLLEFQLK